LLNEMAKIVDANLLIRFLLNDIPAQAKAVEKLLQNQKEELILTDVTVAEIIWVLTSYYEIPKMQVVEKMRQLLSIQTIQANKKLLAKAFLFYDIYNIAYIDAYLVAYSMEDKLEGIYSFDQGLDKVKILKRFEP
jgi:uncharacterized protein